MAKQSDKVYWTMRLNLVLSRQEFTWLYNYIGASSDFGIAVPIYNRMKTDALKLMTLTDLHTEADRHQARMMEFRQKAQKLEDELDNKNAGALVQGTG